jgi:hypothetical protein
MLIKYLTNNMSHHNRKHFFDETYFDVIDTEAKAYWLGFLYADGANCDKARNVSLSLTESDAYMLKLLQKELKSDHKIFVKHGSGFVGKPTHMLLMHSVYLCDSLSKQGCTPRKSLDLQFPTQAQVPTKLLRHFIRGYFDGDGSFSTNMKKNKKTLSGQVSIVSSKSFCEELKRLIDAHRKIDGYVKLHRCASGKEVFYYILNGANQIIDFMDWLYKDATVYMARKRDRYRQFLVSRNATMPLRFKHTFVPHDVSWLENSVTAGV